MVGGVDEVDSWHAHLARHGSLCERYGKPEPVDSAAALVVLGVGGLDPDDVRAYRYASVAAASAFAASNLEHYDLRSLGPVVTDGGVIGAVVVPLIACR